jgi:hypothetical protein
MEASKRVGESPVKLKGIRKTNCTTTKVAKTESAVRKNIYRIASDEGTSTPSAGPDSIILQQLKEKFSETTNRSVKVTILTLLPKDWSVRKIEEKFPGVFNYMPHTAKQLVKEYGILQKPNPMTGISLDPEVAYTIDKFYCNDSVSRVIPGKQDYMVIKTGSTKEHKQK